MGGIHESEDRTVKIIDRVDKIGVLILTIKVLGQQGRFQVLMYLAHIHVCGRLIRL